MVATSFAGEWLWPTPDSLMRLVHIPADPPDPTTWPLSSRHASADGLGSSPRSCQRLPVGPRPTCTRGHWVHPSFLQGSVDPGQGGASRPGSSDIRAAPGPGAVLMGQDEGLRVAKGPSPALPTEHHQPRHAVHLYPPLGQLTSRQFHLRRPINDSRHNQQSC